MKGILFKPEVWQAKLRVLEEYGEAVTRRVIKPQPIICKGVMRWEKNKGNRFVSINMDDHADLAAQLAPYRIGETVYIKEAWAEWINTSEHLASGVISIEEARADVIYKATTPNWDEILKENGNPYLIKHTLLMPEWAARYFIKIKAVRAERLQEITLPDCEAEGFALAGLQKGCSTCDTKDYSYYGGRIHFAEVWNSINKDYPWESNPFVFRYEFEFSS